MPARPIGSATISFGLVSVPVKLYSSSESAATVSFNMRSQDLRHPAQAAIHLPQGQGTVVEKDDMAKGYEFAKGQYVLFTPEETQGPGGEGHQLDRHRRVRAARRGRPDLSRESLLSRARQGRRPRLPPAQRGAGGDRARRAGAVCRPGPAAPGPGAPQGRRAGAWNNCTTPTSCAPASEVPLGEGEVKAPRTGAGQADHRTGRHRRVPPGALQRHRTRPGAGGHPAEGRRPGDHRRSPPKRPAARSST